MQAGEESDPVETSSRWPWSDFNPRSHEGSDQFHHNSLAAGHGISIHAPTKGATEIGGGAMDALNISIHAPTKGATGYDAPKLQ